jgi:hypothetical protein
LVHRPRASGQQKGGKQKNRQQVRRRFYPKILPKHDSLLSEEKEPSPEYTAAPEGAERKYRFIIKYGFFSRLNPRSLKKMRRPASLPHTKVSWLMGRLSVKQLK